MCSCCLAKIWIWLAERERDKESHLVAKGKLKCPRCESPPDVLARWMKTGDVTVYSHRWQEFRCHLYLLLQFLGKKEREVKSWEKTDYMLFKFSNKQKLKICVQSLTATEPLLCGRKRQGGMSDRVNRNTLKLCKSLSDQTHLSHRWSRERLWKDIHYSHYYEARFDGCWSEFELFKVGFYLPKKKADKVGLTRSPQADFGFWSRRGPASPMIRAPTGAVRRMASTATVSTSMPYFCSCLSSFVRAMSKAVEPIAAWRRQEHWCFLYTHSQMTFTITTRGNLKEIEKTFWCLYF